MSLAPADTGVPGMVERMRSMPLPNVPDAVPDAVPRSVVMIFGVLVAEERRRCCEESESGSDGESRLGNVRSTETLADVSFLLFILGLLNRVTLYLPVPLLFTVAEDQCMRNSVAIVSKNRSRRFDKD